MTEPYNPDTDQPRRCTQCPNMTFNADQFCDGCKERYARQVVRFFEKCDPLTTAEWVRGGFHA